MPRKKQVDLKKLAEAINAETPTKEIMKKFDIKTTAQLKALYLDVLVDKGQVKPIMGKGGKAKDMQSKSIVVNKRGSLVITKEMVEEMGFQIEDAFTVRKTKAGVSLKKL